MGLIIDDSWDSWTPVVRAGNAAFGVYVRCGLWMARNPTDGYVPSEIALMYGSPEQARRLVDVGLWETAEAGYYDLHYLKLNPTAAVVAKRKADAAARQARLRERRSGVTRYATRDSRATNGVTDGVSSRPLSPPKGGKGDGGRSTAAAPKPKAQFCEKHRGYQAGNCGLCRADERSVKDEYDN